MKKMMHMVVGMLIAVSFLPTGAHAVSYYGQIQQKAQDLKGQIQTQRDPAMQDTAQQRTGMRQEIEKKREEFRAAADARMADFRKKFGEVRAARIKQYFTAMTDRIEAALDRMSQAADRIERMIHTAASAGKDVTKPKEDLAAARTKMQDATTALESAKTKYAELAKNPDPKKAFADVRNLVQTTVAAVKDAHAALIRVLVGLKGLGAYSGNASSTPAAHASSSPAGAGQ